MKLCVNCRDEKFFAPTNIKFLCYRLSFHNPSRGIEKKIEGVSEMKSFLYILHFNYVRLSTMGQSVNRQVRKRVKGFKEGRIFDYDDFQDLDNIKAIAISLCRLIKTKKIQRLAKGKFYKPKCTRFGELPPTESEIINQFLERDRRPIGYFTGNSAFNKLGLTTQVSNVFKIATNGQIGQKQLIGRIKIRFTKCPVTITKENIDLLPILDCLKNILSIPDASLPDSISRLYQMIFNLKVAERNKLSECSLGYNPRTRALLGAMLEKMGDRKNLRKLKRTLNPLTNYKLEGINNTLPQASNWNFV